MSKFDKLLERILSMDNNMRFDELRKVLESFGYTMKGSGSGGSHKTFRKPGKSPITIPTHDPINISYVAMVRKIVESEENDEQDN